MSKHERLTTMGDALVRIIQNIARETALEAVSDKKAPAPVTMSGVAKNLSTQQVAKRLGVSDTAVQIRMKKLDLPGRAGRGKQSYMRMSDVAAWEAERSKRVGAGFRVNGARRGREL